MSLLLAEAGYVDSLWRFLPLGYAVTVVLETPVLLALLSPTHPVRRRLLAGLWLTACTYPVVVLVLPLLVQPLWLYLLVAETFAPAAECLLFSAAFHTGAQIEPRLRRRDWAAIVLANLLSFGLGEVLRLLGWLP